MTVESVDAPLKLEVLDSPMGWQFQIGPKISGVVEGVINSHLAGFFVSPSPPTALTIAEVSGDSGGTWTPLPNDKPVRIAGLSDLQYRIQVPTGYQVKFLTAID